MSKYTKATPGDAQWSNRKQRCWSLLADFARGEHHMQAVVHFGDGLRMVWWNGISTFDGDDLTRLVLLAHQRICRVEITTAGLSHIGIVVHAREVVGCLYDRHPGLDDLLNKVQRMIK